MVSARTRVMSKKVKRVLLVGRVVRKKLTRATQQMLEAVKESRQRSIFTTAAISKIILSNISVLSVVLIFDSQGEKGFQQCHFQLILSTSLLLVHP